MHFTCLFSYTQPAVTLLYVLYDGIKSGLLSHHMGTVSSPLVSVGILIENVCEKWLISTLLSSKLEK